MTKVPAAGRPTAPFGAAMSDYLKEAFFFRWNLLLFAGGVVGAALTPMSSVLLPLVGAGELTYLAALISIPRFRAAIDAKAHAARTGGGEPAAAPASSASLVTMLGGLPSEARQRFQQLHSRCLEMRGIAAGVRGAAGDAGSSAEEIRTPGLDRLLWLFLRLLSSKAALDRFLQSMKETELTTRLADARRGIRHAARFGLGRLDQLVERVERRAGLGHEHEVGIVDRRDRHEVAHQLERLVRDQRFVDGVRVRHQQQRVAVGRALGDRVGADDRAGAGAVVDDHVLPQRLLQPLCDDAAEDIGRAAGCERHDDADRASRVVLRVGGERGQRQKSATQRGCRRTATRAANGGRDHVGLQACGPAR